MAVEAFPLDGEEQITRFGPARIGADILQLDFRRPAPDFSRTGIGDKFQRTFLHNNYFNKKVAVTTAVMVLSSELVSFTPSPLVSLLRSGAI